ncbi:osmotically inducible protein OsmC [Longibacter salinarum]|uniref:Osmotically inducible protein OsmC n=1 Tax=Longibacter salinarum TaxID=1850348 RepID=A0A2A8CUF5_9BACT|nr:OsmC family protein [Longibacter salinarum]PEN12212.1 osmotically inducible protein OsmC [Longibacter salinarum]
MTEQDATSVRKRQDPLRERYKSVPEEATITDRAKTTGGTDTDPFHGFVVPGSENFDVTWPFGIHHAVGGDHDAPNPGDILCAALATCLDSTIRMIAERFGVRLTSLGVDVTAEVDVRGTLHVDRTVPVGFQSMQCDVHMQVEEGTDPKVMKKVLAAAEQSCVVLQTLRSGIPVETNFSEAE